MCVCVSESSRPKLFNWTLVVLISVWVVIVSAVAHAMPGTLDANQEFASFEAAMVSLIDAIYGLL